MVGAYLSFMSSIWFSLRWVERTSGWTLDKGRVTLGNFGVKGDATFSFWLYCLGFFWDVKKGFFFNWCVEHRYTYYNIIYMYTIIYWYYNIHGYYYILILTCISIWNNIPYVLEKIEVIKISSRLYLPNTQYVPKVMLHPVINSMYRVVPGLEQSKKKERL